MVGIRVSKEERGGKDEAITQRTEDAYEKGEGEIVHEQERRDIEE